MSTEFTSEIDSTAEELNSPGTDFIVSELLAELKQENERKSKLLKQKEKHFFIYVVVSIIILLITVLAGIWYLNQYDFTSEQTVSGVYALVDSEGNVIAEDITPEEYDQLMEVIANGEGNNQEIED